MEAILSNCARKLLWFEITKTLIAVLNNKLIVSFFYNFRHTVVPYAEFPFPGLSLIPIPVGFPLGHFHCHAIPEHAQQNSNA